LKFLKCIIYLAINGILGFALGRILPKHWFDPCRFPYKAITAEKDGRFYEYLRVHRWQKALPDASRYFRRIMPPKDLSGDIPKRLPRMLQETCVAELIHWVEGATGFYCVRIWPGMGGVVVALLNLLLLNLPYIIIQRYNRPRLLRLSDRLNRRYERKVQDEDIDTHLQHGRRT